MILKLTWNRIYDLLRNEFSCNDPYSLPKLSLNTTTYISKYSLFPTDFKRTWMDELQYKPCVMCYENDEFKSVFQNILSPTGRQSVSYVTLCNINSIITIYTRILIKIKQVSEHWQCSSAAYFFHPLNGRSRGFYRLKGTQRLYRIQKVDKDTETLYWNFESGAYKKPMTFTNNS